VTLSAEKEKNPRICFVVAVILTLSIAKGKDPEAARTPTAARTFLPRLPTRNPKEPTPSAVILSAAKNPRIYPATICIPAAGASILFVIPEGKLLVPPLLPLVFPPHPSSDPSLHTQS